MRPGPLFTLLLWLTLLFAGMGYWTAYDARPSSPGNVADTRVDPASTELVVFIHPKCPCARAGLAALARTDSTDCRVRIVFVGPETAAADWWIGPNWELANAIPSAKLERDAGGSLARSFGVRTSGHAVLYAADGQLLFSGGLSPTRSASPDRAVLPFHFSTMLADAPREVLRRPVMGCPLFDDAD